MSEQEQEKKKYKKKFRLGINQVPLEELEATAREMRIRIKKAFKFHIGVENGVYPVEVMKEVLNIRDEHLQQWGIYKTEYWWNVIKAIMKQLKRDGEVFIINKHQKYFVLHNKEELEAYKKKIRTDIKNLKSSMKRAEEWVAEKKFLNF